MFAVYRPTSRRSGPASGRPLIAKTVGRPRTVDAQTVMSYTVTIRRPDDRPILEAEVRGLVAADGELAFPSLAEALTGELLFHWTRPGKQPVGFLLSQGQIGSTTTPSDEAVAKMQQLANLLDAVVEGEEGEDLTNVEMPAGRVAVQGVGCYVLALLALLAGAAWLLFFRPAA